MFPDLTHRAAEAHEGIDDPQGDLEKMFRTYDDLTRINVLISGWRRLYVQLVRPYLQRSAATTLLDVGCGGGDITRALVTWANQDGLRLDTTGIDTDARAIEYAQRQKPLAGTRYFHVCSRDLVEAGQQFDLVISNHVLHHFTDRELGGFFSDLEQLVRYEVIVSDLARSRLSYFLFGRVISPFFREDTFIRKDGLTSIERAFTARELRAVLPEGWTYQSQWFDRHVVRYRPPPPQKPGA